MARCLRLIGLLVVIVLAAGGVGASKSTLAAPPSPTAAPEPGAARPAAPRPATSRLGLTNYAWSQQAPAISPSARRGAAMAYDAVSGTIVLFGGYAGGALGDTWVWNGTTWSQQSPSSSPPARYWASLTYDAASGVLVLFGGCCDSSGNNMNDTWTWNGRTWANVTPAPSSSTLTSPTVRELASLAYDAAHGVVVLFGGANGGPLDDTWTWNGGGWTERCGPATQQSPNLQPCGPSPCGASGQPACLLARDGASMDFDAEAGTVLLFGGDNASPLNDTWAWNGSAWLQQGPAASPPARYDAGMAYDGAGGAAVLFGGFNSSNGATGDTWILNGGDWTQQSSPANPPARSQPAMAYDAGRGNVVLFGGGNGSLLQDTWLFGAPPPTVSGTYPGSGPTAGGTSVAISGTNFNTTTGLTSIVFGTALATSMSCSSTTQCTATSPTGSGMVDVRVTAGGQTSTVNGSDEFTYTTGTPTGPLVTGISPTAGLTAGGTSVAISGTNFSTMAAATSVSFGANQATSVACSSSSQCTATSPAGSGMVDVGVTVGSQTSTASSADQFTYTTGAPPVPTVTGISPTSGSTSGGTFVAISGSGFSTASGSTGVNFGQTPATNVSCSSSANCSATSPAGSGAVDVSVTTAGQTSAISSADQFTYATGGTTQPLGTWTNENPARSPGGRSGASMAYDASAGEVVLFGGRTCAGGLCVCNFNDCPSPHPLGDLWTWDPGGWAQPPASGGGNSPAARADAAMAYDAASGTILLFGGSNGSALGDTWTWDGSLWTNQQASAAVPPPRVGASLAYDKATSTVVLFGGYNIDTSNNFNKLNDTWTWNGKTASWTQQFPAVSPPAQSAASMTYDDATASMVLFGTNGSTWIWDGGAWTQQNPATSPTPRADASMVYDAAAGTVVLFGGSGWGSPGCTGYCNETWIWNGRTWANTAPRDRPSARQDAAVAYDAATGSVLLYGGFYSPSGSNQFFYLGDTWTWFGLPLPTVTRISPASGPPNGGSTVTISGSNFSTPAGATTVNFGANAGTNTSCSSSTSCSATTPAGTGTMDVTVTVGGLTSAITAADQYTYVPPPSVTALSATSGPAAGGTSVTITGMSLGGATSVRFGLTAAPSLTVNSPAQITATSPFGANTVDITVVTPYGTSATNSADQFSYVPSVTAISPANGPAGGGTSVTITGTGFDTIAGATTINFGPNAATNAICTSLTNCTATSPAFQAGATVDVFVFVGSQQSALTSADLFSYNIGPAPTVTGINPATGPSAGGTQVTISGTNFDSTPGSTLVYFGAKAATNVACSSTTQCMATSPAGSGIVDVTVAASASGSTSNNADRFTYDSGATPQGGIAIPSYFYPGPLWTQLDQAAPAVALAVINPDSGPGASADPNYASQTQQSQSAGLTVLGYVDTNYAGRTTAAVEADIDSYFSWYHVDGIFFDRGSTDCTNESYYAALDQYVKAKGGKGVVALNPGTQTNECYMAAADIIVNFEGSNATYVGSYSAPSWVRNYPPNRFWQIVYSAAATTDMQTAVSLSKERNADWVYVTAAGLPNPYSSLPSGSYWTAELAAVSSPVSPVLSTVVASPTNALAGSASGSTVTVTLNDNSGHAVSGKTVGLTASSTNSSIAPTASGSDTTNSQGHATFTVKDSTAETVTYAATSTSDGVPLQQTAQVQFTSGAAPTVTTISPTSGPSSGGTPVTIMGTGFDTSATAVSFIPPNGMPSTSNAATNVGCSSSTSCTVTSPAGSGVVDVIVNTPNGGSAANPNDEFTYTGSTSAVSATVSTVTADHTSVPDDGMTQATLTVTLKDQNGAVVSGKTVSLGQPSGSHSTITPASASTVNGVASFKVSDATAEAATYTATDTSDSPTVALSQTETINFTAVAVSQTRAPVGGSVTVTVTVNSPSSSAAEHAASRGVSGQTVTLTANAGSQATITCQNNANPCLTDANGRALFSVTDSTTQGLTLTATDTTTNQTLGTTTLIFGTLPRGDVNGDDQATSVDALCVLRTVAGLPGTAACPQPLPGNPDVNGDGHVTAVDALCVLRLVAGLPETPACTPPSASAAHAATTAAETGSVAFAPASSPSSPASSPSSPASSLSSPPSFPGKGAGGLGNAILSLKTSTTTSGQGRLASVAVQADASESGLGAWTIDVRYDPKAVKVAGCQAGDGSICNTGYAAGVVRITGASASGLHGAQTLATLTVEELHGGTVANALTLAPVELTNPAGERLTPEDRGAAPAPGREAAS